MYRCILADPPWPQSLRNKRKRAKEPNLPIALPYPTMSVQEIADLDVGRFAEPDCHLWLWTTNQHLESGFQVMRAWGFKFLAPVHWVKPSGVGNYFVHLTQTLLFGYRERCHFPLARYLPNVIHASPPRHSEKPEAGFQMIESVSPGPRLELFARRKRSDWDVWGNEVECSIDLSTA